MIPRQMDLGKKKKEKKKAKCVFAIMLYKTIEKEA